MSIAEFKSSKHELVSFIHLLSIDIKETLTFKKNYMLSVNSLAK